MTRLPYSRIYIMLLLLLLLTLLLQSKLPPYHRFFPTRPLSLSLVVLFRSLSIMNPLLLSSPSRQLLTLSLSLSVSLVISSSRPLSLYLSYALVALSMSDLSLSLSSLLRAWAIVYYCHSISHINLIPLTYFHFVFVPFFY